MNTWCFSNVPKKIFSRKNIVKKKSSRARPPSIVEAMNQFKSNELRIDFDWWATASGLGSFYERSTGGPTGQWTSLVYLMSFTGQKSDTAAVGCQSRNWLAFKPSLLVVESAYICLFIRILILFYYYRLFLAAKPWKGLQWITANRWVLRSIKGRHFIALRSLFVHV